MKKLYGIHPLANLFPMMTEDEYVALVEDIHIHGQREPIWIYDGKIIDGRNRYKACLELGREPITKEWDGNGSLVEFIVTLNLHRRHLSSGQRAVIALDIENLLAEEAKQYSGGRPKTEEKPTQKIEHVSKNDRTAAAQAATIVHSNRQYISDAKQIQKKSPVLLEQVKAGSLTLTDAKILASKTEFARAAIISKVATGSAKSVKEAAMQVNRAEKIAAIVTAEPPQLETMGRFPLVYCDPPWHYEHCIDANDAIEVHYPTMSLEEICAMPIKSITTPDCVLFMWATSPKLFEAMQVLTAWGFTYKTHAVWDKEWIGPGYYFRQQHEDLLVATKGSIPVPLPENRQPSIFRVRRTAHSVKPEVAYQLIEVMYPELPKLELFARQQRPGWKCWGNQIEAA